MMHSIAAVTATARALSHALSPSRGGVTAPESSRQGLFAFRRSPRVSSGPEWAAREETPTGVHPLCESIGLSARDRNSFGAAWWKTSAKMNRIAASWVLWASAGSGKEASQVLPPLGTLWRTRKVQKLDSLPSWIDSELWAEYVAQRKKDKKEMSPRSALGRIKRLYEIKAAGHDPNAAIEEALNGHWLDFYAPVAKQIERAPTTAAEETQKYIAAQRMTPEERAASEEARKRVMAKIGGTLRRVA